MKFDRIAALFALTFDASLSLDQITHATQNLQILRFFCTYIFRLDRHHCSVLGILSIWSCRIWAWAIWPNCQTHNLLLADVLLWHHLRVATSFLRETFQCSFVRKLFSDAPLFLPSLETQEIRWPSITFCYKPKKSAVSPRSTRFESFGAAPATQSVNTNTLSVLVAIQPKDNSH